MKLRTASRNLYRYVRHDLREIVWPSSLPNPPGYEATRPQKLTLKEHLQVWRMAFKYYGQSWKGITPDLEQNEDKQHSVPKVKELTLSEELALAAKAGSHNMQPVLQKIYMTRATAYRDALREFVSGYQEGMSESARENERDIVSQTQSQNQSQNPQTVDFASQKKEKV